MLTAVASPPYLTDEELDGICRPLRHHAARIRYIKDVLKIPVQRRPDGSPLVKRLDWERYQAKEVDHAPVANVVPRRMYHGSALQRYHQEHNAAMNHNARESDACLVEYEKIKPKLDRARRLALISHHASKRRCEKLKRTPPWADLHKIRLVYEEARRITKQTGIKHCVDHVIPLQGKLVCGLHVHHNLRVITSHDNSRKRNKFTPC